LPAPMKKGRPEGRVKAPAIILATPRLTLHGCAKRKCPHQTGLVDARAGSYAATCLLSCPADTVPEIRKPIHIKATKFRGCGQNLPSGHRPVRLRTGGVG
jgi:hypothetical protein